MIFSPQDLQEKTVYTFEDLMARSRASDKFLARFAAVGEASTKKGRKMADCTKNALIFFWIEQKNTEKSTKFAKK